MTSSRRELNNFYLFINKVRLRKCAHVASLPRLNQSSKKASKPAIHQSNNPSIQSKATHVLLPPQKNPMLSIAQLQKPPTSSHPVVIPASDRSLLRLSQAGGEKNTSTKGDDSTAGPIHLSAKCNHAECREKTPEKSEIAAKKYNIYPRFHPFS